MAGAAVAPPLPDQKTKGWEFTDLSKLDLESYERADAEVTGIGESAANLDEPVVMTLAGPPGSPPPRSGRSTGALWSPRPPRLSRAPPPAGARASSSTCRREKSSPS